MAVLVLMDVLSGRVCAVLISSDIRQAALIVSYHLSPDLIYVSIVSVIHHVRCISACRSHIDFESYKVSDFTEVLPCLCEAEELEVYESAPYLESFYGCASVFTELFRHLRSRVVSKLESLVYEIRYRWREPV